MSVSSVQNRKMCPGCIIDRKHTQFIVSHVFNQYDASRNDKTGKNLIKLIDIIQSRVPL